MHIHSPHSWLSCPHPVDAVADADAEADPEQPNSASAALAAIKYPDRYGATVRPLAFNFAIWARVAAFPAMTLLQAAALRVERMELEDGLAVALLLGIRLLDLAEAVTAVSRLDMAASPGANVVAVAVKEAAAGVLNVAANGTLPCGEASAAAAKSKTREVGFILTECLLWRSVNLRYCRVVLQRIGNGPAEQGQQSSLYEKLPQWWLFRCCGVHSLQWKPDSQNLRAQGASSHEQQEWYLSKAHCK